MKYVALLRGIAPLNPNMRNEKLRGVFEELGLTNVQSVISSGNIIFETTETNVSSLEARLEKAWPEKLGFTSTTIIRSLEELQKLVSKNPYKGKAHKPTNYQLVTFFKRPTKISFKLPYQPPGREYFLIGKDDRTLFSVVNIQAAKTPDLMTWLEKQFGKDITSRTFLTIQRILKKMEGQP